MEEIIINAREKLFAFIHAKKFKMPVDRASDCNPER
jgi:hypothetical protein